VLEYAQPVARHNHHVTEVHRPSIWTGQQLGASLALLQEMPLHLSLTGPDGRRLHFTHGSMLGLRDGIYPETSDAALKARIGLNGAGPAPDEMAPLALFCVGHTHRPLVRWLEGVLVVNAGSTGLPFDGDTRPSYARLTCRGGAWQAEIVRIDYDLAQAEHDFYETGYLAEAGPLVELVLVELQQARSMLYQWAVQYQERVLAGELSMAEAVHAFQKMHRLKIQPGVRPSAKQ
jgi:predicted phosphodiesterase